MRMNVVRDVAPLITPSPCTRLVSVVHHVHGVDDVIAVLSRAATDNAGQLLVANHAAVHDEPIGRFSALAVGVVGVNIKKPKIQATRAQANSFGIRFLIICSPRAGVQFLSAGHSLRAPGKLVKAYGDQGSDESVFPYVFA